MGEKFFNADHSRMKLNGTICLFKGIPYYIRHDGDAETVTASPLDGLSREFRVDYTDPDFDYTHIPLGYMTVEGSAYYLAREPQRINTQGLTWRAVRAIGTMSGSNRGMDALLFRKEFIDCVQGKHVDFKTALSLLKEGAKGISISRHMAVIRQSSRIYIIEYRGRTIALSQNRGESFVPIEHKGVHIIMKRLQNNGVPV